MPSTQSQDIPAQPDASLIPHLVSSIVSKARENDNLTSLTPRLVRSEVETKLGVPGGTLDAPAYKTLVKRAIHDAMKREKTTEVNEGSDSRLKKSVTKPQVGGSGRSKSKSMKSKETITDSECEEEPTLSTFGRKVRPDTRADIDKEKLVQSNPKPVFAKVDSKASKDSSPSMKATHLSSKRRPLPIQQSQSDSDAEGSDTIQRVPSSSRRVTDNQKSDSEMSPVDEPPKKKARSKSKNSEAEKSGGKSKRSKQSNNVLSKDEETIKRLKSLVVACGVRKQWARELSGLNASAQITHIRKILGELGMAGRLSLEQAREIRAQRELAQELDDVQKFERAIVSGKPFETERSSRRVVKRGGGDADDADDGSDPGSEDAPDHEPAKTNNARRSIMAFLQDQSSDDD